MFIEVAAALGIDAAIFRILSKEFHSCRSHLNELKNAPMFPIDSNLAIVVENYPDREVPYAMVTGAVQIIKRNWFGSLKYFWTRQNDLVPFSLVSPDDLKVEVVNPNNALSLPVSFFKGEHYFRIQEFENMPVEEAVLTGIGKLTLENGIVSLRPSSNNLYYLTTLSPQEMVQNLQQKVNNLQFYRIIVACVGIGIVTRALYLWLKQRKAIKEQNRTKELKRQRKSIEEQNRTKELIRQRQAIEEQNRTKELIRQRKLNHSDNSNELSLECVICYLNPVELAVVPCGHASFCRGCSKNISRNCPICRQHIQSFLPLFFS